MAAPNVKIFFWIRFYHVLLPEFLHVAEGIFPVVFCMVYKIMSFAEIMKQPLERLD